MTTPHSGIGDNFGLCECCDSAVTRYETQTTYPVYLGGYVNGPIRGTLWVCNACRSLLEERDADATPGRGKWTPELRARMEALRARKPTTVP